MSAAISRDEWLKALTEAGLGDDAVDDQDAVTTREFCAMFGYSETTARRKLSELVTIGKATRTFKVSSRSGGHRVRIPAFRLAQPARKRKA